MKLDLVRVDELHSADRHIIDAMKFGAGAARTNWQVEPEPPLAKFKDYELVMELIKRGYAAMKLPEGGGVPEVLKR